MDLTTGSDPAGPADTTELLRYAEALLVDLAAGGTAPALPPGATDVPGYWLAPAIQALVHIMSGEDALEPLSHAAQLDPERTALFLCLALAVSGQGDRIHASWLGTAFGDLAGDRPVTSGQRALWLAAARGAYGPVGKIFVLRKLDAIAVPPEDELWLKALAPGEPAVVVPPSLNDFPDLAEVPELAAPAHAAARLTRLRGRCTEITSSRQPARPSNRPPGDVWADAEPLAVLRMLVGHGGPERPLCSISGHLLHDVRPGSDPHLAALALHVAAPAVKAAAETLVAAAQAPPPETVTVPILGHPITLHPEGPDYNSIREAERRIVTGSVPGRPAPWLAYALIGLAVVVFGTGFAVSLPLALAGLGLGGWGGFLLWQRRVQEQTDQEYVESKVAELRELAESAVWALHEYARESEKRGAVAAEDLVELTRLLRRGPRAA